MADAAAQRVQRIQSECPLHSLWSSLPLRRSPRASPLPPCLAALRHRELAQSAAAFNANFLAREVEYARASTSVYTRVLKEVHAVKADIAAADERHLGGLGRQLSGARIVAARVVGML